MAPPPQLVFLATFGLAIVVYGILTLGLPIVLRLAEFHFRGTHLFTVFSWRYLVAAVLAGITAVYLYWREDLPTTELAYMAVIVSVVGWGVLLLVWDVLSADPLSQGR